MVAVRKGLAGVKVPVPAYLNVTFVFLLAVFMICALKVMLDGLNDSKLLPVPVIPTNCGLVGSLSWMTSVALFAPGTSGSKVIPMTQLVVIAPVQVLLAMV